MFRIRSLHSNQSQFLKTARSHIVLIRNIGWLYSNVWEDLEVEVLRECNVHHHPNKI